MTDRGADLEVLHRVTANRAMLDYLRAHSVPRTPRNASSWDIDDYELHSHPDLSERLEEVANHLPGGGRFRGAYGYAVLIDDRQIVRAVALGNAGLALRLTDPAIRADVVANSRFRWDRLGEEWVGADPWPVDIPLALGTERVRGWLTAAFETPVPIDGAA